MRLVAFALIAIAATALSLPASAQQVFGGDRNIYIDGNTPVDSRTSARVDAYIIHKELLDHEEAERRERHQLFIFHDRIHSSYNSALY